MALVLAVLACEDRTGGDVGSTELLAACTGTFVCGGDELNRLVLSRAGPDCRLSQLILRPDHTIYDTKEGRSTGRWEGDSNAFALCPPAGQCLRCVLASSHPPSPGTCLGPVTDCSSRRSPSDCMIVPGCMVTDAGCVGTHTPCSTFSERAACVTSGCRWSDDTTPTAP